MTDKTPATTWAVPDDVLPLNCPQCPRPLRYMRATDDGGQLYVCVAHGWFLLASTDGRLHETRTPPERTH